jgi:hypothetical protein
VTSAVAVMFSLTITAYVFYIYVRPGSGSSFYSSAVTIGSVVVAIASIVPLILEYARRRSTRAARARIGQAIQDQAGGVTVNQAVQNILQRDSESSEAAVRRAFLSAVLDTTRIASRADALVFDFLPDRPRAAKRLLNQVRLMILIATDRGLLVLKDTTDQDQRADRIGKWLVLRERWPEIVKLVERDSDKMTHLEVAARGGVRSLERSLRDYDIGGVDNINDLWRLLTRGAEFGDLSELTFFRGVPKATDDRVANADNGSEGNTGKRGRAPSRIKSTGAIRDRNGGSGRMTRPEPGRRGAEVGPPRFPLASVDQVTVQRIASKTGVISVGGQKIPLGRSHAGQVVTVHVTGDTISIDMADDDARSVRRTTTQRLRNIKDQGSRNAVGAS